MGLLRFLAPHRDRLPGGALEQAYLTGLEAVPFPSRNRWEGDELIIARDIRESGNLHILWQVPQRGPLLLSTASLMERERPYLLPVELARGTLNRLRNQQAMWQSMGLNLPLKYERLEHEAMQQFARAATSQTDTKLACAAAEAAIVAALTAMDELADSYVTQVLALRHEQMPKLATILGATLPQQPLLNGAARGYTQAFNAAVVPLAWRGVEPSAGEWDFSGLDRQFAWLADKPFKVCGGPLLRLDASALPDWLYLWEDDYEAIQNYVLQFTEKVVERYRGQVQVWHCASGLNVPGGLGLSEEQKLRLAVMMIDTVRRTDPRTPVIVSFDQPWGEYLQQEEMDLPPYHFADALVRADLGLAGIGLEINLGYWPGGSLPRDIFELSRLIDRWSMLGVPLLTILCSPSHSEPDPLATNKAMVVDRRISPAIQAETMNRWLGMLLAKQSVHGIFWSQFSDAESHRWPHGGLVGDLGDSKPLLSMLSQLRDGHLA